MSWTEVDSAVTDPVQTDIPLGPVATVTSILGRMVAALDNLPTQHPHYPLLTAYFNEAKDELLRTAVTMNRGVVLNMVPRLRNWRWYDVTVAGQNWLPLPERMLDLANVYVTRDQTAYDTSTSTLYPLDPVSDDSPQDFNLLRRDQTGWPTLYRRAGGRVELHPVPSSSPTDYVTTIVVEGLRLDRDLSADADALLMPPHLQVLAIDFGVATAMEKMGWDEAAKQRDLALGKLTRLIGPAVRERLAATPNTRAAGMPR